MAISDEIEIVGLGAGDVDAGLALSDEAGWNQTAEDWRLIIGMGHAIGVRDAAGKLIASAAALPYEGPLGYVAMVLVTRSQRRRGIATELVQRCIGTLTSMNRVPMLDATPDGVKVYGRQGFRPLFGLARWQGETAYRGEGRSNGTIRAADIATVVELDRATLGAARPQLVRSFLERPGTRAIAGESADRVAVIRDGRKARQVGPVIAPSEPAAIELLETIMSDCIGRVFIDVPDRWHGVAEWLGTRGFAVQRSFTRMAYECSDAFGDYERLFALAGPEFG